MSSFPAGFVWGTATSSFQIEGAWLEGGKGPSIWDAFAHIPGKISDGTTADVSCDHFHRWKEDVAYMADLGLRAYRFSISWPRIQPAGRGKVNPEGIRFYAELIDALLAHGITPWVTLYHWDLPLALQLELDGWLNPALAGLYKEYAAICFEAFGDRVKHWITFNEPWVVSIMGHGQGIFAPGRMSNAEPYQVAHTILRAHGLAVREYRDRFQGVQGGRIGMANNCDWREPRTEDPVDKAAAGRAVEFFLGWFGDPLYRGDYPDVMRARLGSRLPSFTSEEQAMIRGSQDFFGLNHYTTMYASHSTDRKSFTLSPFANGGISEDQDVRLSMDPDWTITNQGWGIVPWGCRKLLHWIDQRYDHPEIVLTENGCSLPDVLHGATVDDQKRIDYLHAYLSACHQAIGEGVRLGGYFLWSLLDNFEWSSGYTPRFGITYVDFATGRRIPKSSAQWYSRLARTNVLPPLGTNQYRDLIGDPHESGDTR